MPRTPPKTARGQKQTNKPAPVRAKKSMTADGKARRTSEIAALQTEIEKLSKRAGLQKKKLIKRESEIADLKRALVTRDTRINDLERDLAQVEREKDHAIEERDAAQTNLDVLVARMNREDAQSSFGGRPIEHRSQTRDSLAILSDEGRSPVESTVTTVRPKLRTPPRIKPFRP
jgi:predicted  nucleic acid-binding Zn-ribbon protein